MWGGGGVKFVNIEEYIKTTLQNETLLENYQTNKNKGIVLIKKFCGMHWAMGRYKFILNPDCDVIFRDKLATQNLFNNAISNYNKRIYFAFTRPNPQPENVKYWQILETCASFFKNYDYFKKLTNNWFSYQWYYDVPSYDCEHLQKFFKYMEKESPRNFWLDLSWYSFEHILFMFWRFTYFADCVFVDYTKELGIKNSPEHSRVEQKERILYKYDYYPVWTSLGSIFAPNADIIHKDKIAFCSHIDRI